MTNLCLSFPVFYQCVVKNNTSLRQYDAVHLLLLGQLRQNCGTRALSDAVTSNYVSGRKQIAHELYMALLSTSPDEVAQRIRRLSLRDAALAVKNLRYFLPEDLLSRGSDFQGSNTDDSLYHFLADVFLLSLQCPYDKLHVIKQTDIMDTISSCKENKTCQSDTDSEQTINIPQTYLAPDTVVNLRISRHSQPDIVLRVQILGTEKP